MLVPIFFLEFQAQVCLKRKQKGDICAILPWEQMKIQVFGSLKYVCCIGTGSSAWRLTVVP